MISSPRHTLAALALISGAALFPHAARPQAPPPANPAYAAIQDEPGLPRVLLIGDSISVGYTLPVRNLLKGKANVHRVPENAGPTTNGVKKIDKWLDSGRWDVIHFNWGLHDLKFMDDGRHQLPVEQYEANLRKLVGKLKATGAKLVWASTTPVPEGRLNPPRKNGDVVLFNAAAARVMQEAGIPADDLYGFALPRLKEIQRPENVHFTEAGSEALAGYVVRSIQEALK